MKSGSGILERYSNGSELGRGLNEGYTEWICEKCGYKTFSYQELTNFVRLLELALGTEKTMELGKGNINSRFPEILDMSKENVIDLLINCDNLYKINDNLRIAIRLRDIVERKIKDKENQASRNTSKYIDYLEVFAKIKTSDDYKHYLGENEDTFEMLLNYMNDNIEKLNEKRNSVIVFFESNILDKYFIKDIERVMNEKPENIDKDDFEKITKIISVLNTSIKDKNEDNKNLNFSSVKIKNEYEGFKNKYMKGIGTKAGEQYKTGNLPFKNFIRYIKDLNDYSIFVPEDIFNDLIKSINPEFESEIYEIYD